jgi:hypothetical protein
MLTDQRRGRITRMVAVSLAAATAVSLIAAASAQAQDTAAAVASRLLFGVACTSASNCWSVGTTELTATDLVTLAEHWNGSKWSVVATPNLPHSTDNSLHGVACVSASYCWAVGGAVTGSQHQGTAYAEHWNGSKWSLTVLPKPSGAANTEVASVACTSTSNCWATGTAAPPGFTSGPTLAEHWNGKNWSVAASPSLGGANGLNAVTCATSTSCQAVGTGGGGLLAEQWNGSKWSIATTQPAGASADFFGDACAGSACIAAGIRGGTKALSLAERWTGTQWVIMTTPNPANASLAELTGVSCPKANSCMVAGFAFIGSATGAQTLTERLNGTTWSIVPSPNPTASVSTTLQGLTCTSTANCWAVGQWQNGSGADKTLAERWNGTKWSIVTTP